MTITAISRDWGTEPCVVRITTTDNLAAITTADYLLDQEDSIIAVNIGSFTWLDGDLAAIDYSGGKGVFSYDSTNNTFVWADSIPDGSITTAKLADGAVTYIKLDVPLRPTSISIFLGQLTTSGGSATEDFTITGLLLTDKPFLQLYDNGPNNVSILSAGVIDNTLSVTFSGNPGTGTIFGYNIQRDSLP